jgi:hypothetical protein
MKGGRQLSDWNLFVKKVYDEGKEKDPDYEFKEALVDASKRKSEMNSVSGKGVKTAKKSRKVLKKSKSKGKRSMAMAMAGGKRSMAMAMAGGKTKKHKRRH